MTLSKKGASAPFFVPSDVCKMNSRWLFMNFGGLYSITFLILSCTSLAPSQFNFDNDSITLVFKAVSTHD